MPDTITVASKMSLRLRLYEMVDSTEGSPSGPRPCKRAQQVGPDVLVAGPKLWRGEDAVKHPRQELYGGYALTQVDKTFWEKWCAQNHDSDLLRNKIVIAHSKDSPGMAREHAATKTGFEPLDMVTTMTVKIGDKLVERIADPRVPGRLGGTSGISTAEESNQPVPSS